MTTFDEAWYADYQARRSAERQGRAINPPGTRFIDRDKFQSGNAATTPVIETAAPSGAGAEHCAPRQFKRQRKKQNRPEQELQKAAIKMLDAALPAHWRVIHVPNGGWRSPIEAAILKAMGVREGFCDLLLMGPGHKAGRFVVIELKAKGLRGDLTEAQEEWRDWFLAIGADWFLAETLEEIQDACLDAGIPLKKVTFA